MQKKKTLVVFFGGNSYEREVSVITGLLCANLLKEEYDVLPVYLSAKNRFYAAENALSLTSFRDRIQKAKPVVFADGECFEVGKTLKRRGKISVALNCCHGGVGENGTLAGYCALCGIPLASPPLAASAIFMDKVYTKYLALALDIPTAKYFVLKKGEELPKNAFFPFIAKPACLGSSIGVEKILSLEEWEKKRETLFDREEKLLCEEYLENKTEATCAAYERDGEIILSPVWESFSGPEIYDFSLKYEKQEHGKRQRIEGEAAEDIRSYTRKLYRETSCKGLVRADFFLVDGKVYFNELNAVPGSLGFGQFTERLFEQKKILLSLLDEAYFAPPEKKAQIMTDILNKKEYMLVSGCKI